MSGPKVVNIEAVRRQRQRESAAHLRELNALVEECLRLQSAPAAAADIRKHAEALLTRLDQLRARERRKGLHFWKSFFHQRAVRHARIAARLGKTSCGLNLGMLGRRRLNGSFPR